MDKGESADDPKQVVRHVLAILDALDTGQSGADLSVNTVSFLALLHQSEAQGDLLYASPEQARGERMDERSLVFSIGVLIFEKITGRHPFGADGNPRRLARIQKAEMASGVAYFQTISGPLRSILLKCMGPFPDERWRTIAELRQQLEAFVEDRSEARANRNLPALPAEDDEVTNFMVKPASLKALHVAAEREVGRRPQSIGAAPPSPEAKLGLTAKLTWMLAGGALAAVAIWLASAGGKKGADENAEAKSAAKVAQVAPQADDKTERAAPAPAKAAGSVDSAPVDSAPAAKKAVQPAPTPTVQAMPAAGAPTVDLAADFDIEVGGKLALAALSTCFAAERYAQGLDLGVSLYYLRTGVSKKVFFGGGQISSAERSCLSSALIGLTAGGAPENPTTVSYSFFLAGDQSRVKARVANP